MCNTHQNVRRERAVPVLQKNVRATGECVYTPLAHTVVATTWVRTPMSTTSTTKISKKTLHHHLDRKPSNFLIFLLISLTRTWSTSLLSTNHQMYELILLGFPRHARPPFLDDAFVWNFESEFWFIANCHFQLLESVCTILRSYFLECVHFTVLLFGISCRHLQ